MFRHSVGHSAAALLRAQTPVAYPWWPSVCPVVATDDAPHILSGGCGGQLPRTYVYPRLAATRLRLVHAGGHTIILGRTGIIGLGPSS